MAHIGKLCSFDAFLLNYELRESALQQLALIVLPVRYRSLRPAMRFSLNTTN